MTLIMAANGFLDKKTVKSLASMYGGKDKSLFLSQGVELLQSCPMGAEGFERYLWDAKYPMRVICNAPKGTCDCLSRNRYVNVKVTVEQQDPRLGLVPPGNYHYCLCLTDEMMEAAKHVYSQEVVSKIAAIIKRK